MTLLAEAAQDTADAAAHTEIVSLLWVMLAAVAAPILTRLVRDYVAGVVFLLVLGMLIGPHVAGLAESTSGVGLLSELGLGMLFLLAGYELDPALLRGKTGRTATGAWIAGLAVAVGLTVLSVWVLTDNHQVGFTAVLAIAIAMTSTTLGTLLPILKKEGLLGGPVGRAVLTHGAVGELGPVLAMALLLTGREAWGALIVLVIFALAALVLMLVPEQISVRHPGVSRILDEMRGGSVQLPIRVVFLLLVVLMAEATLFDLDVVLGAFAAGAILRRLVGAERHDIQGPLEAIGYGVLIPVFFVVSGMGIDPSAVADRPLVWLLFIVAILLARGLPVWLGERLGGRFGDLPSRVETNRERTRIALYSAAGLPIIVAVTTVAVDTDLLEPAMASVMVAAGAATVLLFPLIAKIIAAPAPPAGPLPEAQHEPPPEAQRDAPQGTPPETQQKTPPKAPPETRQGTPRKPPPGPEVTA